MSDLASLLKYAPGSAGFMIGQNNGQARQSEYIKQQELKQLIAQRMSEEQRKQQMAPLDMQKAQLGIDGLRAGLPGIEADSLLKTLNSQFTQATQPQAIEAKKSAFDTQVDKDKHDVADRFQKWTRETVVSLEGVPPPARKAALIERMQASKMNPNNPMAQRMLAELDQKDPATWPDYFMKMSDKLGKMAAQQNPAYRSSVENNQRDVAERRYATDVRSRDSRYQTDESNRVRLEIAKTKNMKDGQTASSIATKLGYEKAATYATFKAMEAETEEEKAMWEGKAQQFQEAHLRGKRAGAGVVGRPDPEAIGIDTIPLEGPNLGRGPAPAGAAQVGPPGSPGNPIKLK